jgi:hypothetical protein
MLIKQIIPESMRDLANRARPKVGAGAAAVSAVAAALATITVPSAPPASEMGKKILIKKFLTVMTF